VKLSRAGIGWQVVRTSFSILKRIVMGETFVRTFGFAIIFQSFSILKRIVMGETNIQEEGVGVNVDTFQYPQADRDG